MATSMTKYQNELRLFILFSLIITSLKFLFDLLYLLLYVENKFHASMVIITFMLALSLGQVFGIINNKKHIWLLSTIQFLLIYFTSEGTFGWLFNYIFKSFNLFQVSYSYFISACLLMSELFKTVWLFKKIN
jgi:hypothetical protein